MKNNWFKPVFPRLVSPLGAALVLVGLAMLSPSVNAAVFKSSLQGQDKGSSIWKSGQSLSGWYELDLIPVRTYFTGGPVSNEVITVYFDHSKNSGVIRGFQNLTSFTASSNVIITAGPNLTSAPGVDVWSYDYTVTVTDDQPGFVEFRARLAAGAHLFTGSSLGLAKPTLSIFKPAAVPGQPDLAITKTGASLAGPGDIVTYAVTYTNKLSVGETGIGVQVTDSLPAGMTYVPGSASHGGTIVGSTLTWDLGDLQPGESASLTYKVQISTNLIANTTLVNDAQIQSAQDDVTPADNLSSFTTTIVPDPQPIANDDAYVMPDNSTLVIPASGVLTNDTVDLPITLTAWLLTPPNNGVVSLQTNGGFSYIPNTNFVGIDFFTYRALALTNFSGPAVVTITVTNTDFQPPVINCPADIVVSNDLGQCGATVDFTVTAVDGRDGIVPVISTPASGSSFPTGTTVVTNTATDGAGNTSMCTFSVTVVDAEAPQISCPSDLVVSNDLGQCDAVVTFAVTASDNCSVPTVVSEPASGSMFPSGTTVVTNTATDAAGNTSVCTFSVTVVDSEPPQITCPTNILVVVPFDSTNGVVNFPDPVVTDNCTVAWTNCSAASGSVFPLGTTIVSCEAADAAGNTDICSFTVTVVPDAPPDADVAVFKSASSLSNQLGAQILFTLTATNLGPDPATNVVLFDPLPVGFDFTAATNGIFTNGAVIFEVSNLPAGAATNLFVVLTATDVGLLTNTVTVSSDVRDLVLSNNTDSVIVSVVDGDPPVITCPNDMIVSNDLGQCDAIVDFIVTAVDEQDGVVPVLSTPPSGSVFPSGTTVVTNTATDAAGNSSVCTFSVTVVDAEAPQISCPADLVVSNDLGQCDAVVNFAVTASDNCSTPTVVSVPASGSVFPSGTTVVTNTATDAAGNVSVCTFTVWVEDEEAPQISCPSDIVVSNDLGQCGAVVDFIVSSVDNCSTSSVVSVPVSGSVFPSGTTVVTSTATDAAGNTNVCTFNVTVVDAEAPQISCPSDIVVSNDLGQCGAVVNFIVSSVDNCSTSSVVSEPASGSTFPTGTTVVTSTATDAAGNTNVCTFNVTVVDAEPPQIICPTNIVEVVPFGTSNAVVNFPNPVVTDNCGVAWTNSSPASGSVFPLGTTVVSCQAADVAGNTNVCSFTVTVNALPPPEADLAVSQSVNSPSNQVGDQFTFTLSATNLGPDLATGVVLFNPIPVGMQFTSAPGGVYTNGAVRFDLPDLPSGAGTNFSLVLTSVSAGQMTNTVTISSEVYDPELSNNTSTVIIDVQVPQILDLQAFVISPMVLNHQTGLMEQTILLTNAGNITVAGARVFLCGMPSNSVYNASGYDTNGCAYVDYPATLAPGDSHLFEMQYYLRFAVDDPQLSVEVIQPPAPPVIVRVERQADGGILIEFTSIPGRAYEVRYSDDILQTWKAATPPITAAGSQVQWLDEGPPKTESHPVTRNTRFYLVVLINN